VSLLVSHQGEYREAGVIWASYGGQWVQVCSEPEQMSGPDGSISPGEIRIRDVRWAYDDTSTK
jgi:hypothetical protein